MSALRVVMWLGIWWYAGTLLAADVPDSQDLAAVVRPEHAEIMAYRREATVERLYPRGAASRIGGRLRLEDELVVQGSWVALTYELPQGHDPVAALDKVRRQLQQASATALSWCEGRDCGSSSVIANAIFDQSRLYGPDDQQAYLLMRLAPPLQDRLLALYAITRGNRRAYLHVEQVDAAAPLVDFVPSPATLLRQLKRDGELHLPQLAAAPTSEWSELLSQSLKLDGGVRVRIGGDQAQAWRDALVRLRIPESRLSADDQRKAGLYLER